MKFNSVLKILYSLLALVCSVLNVQLWARMWAHISDSEQILAIGGAIMVEIVLLFILFVAYHAMRRRCK